MDKVNYFASNIKFLRKSRKLTQQEVCAYTGFKQSTLSGYESGSSTPNFNDLLKIIEYYDISASELLETDLRNVEVIAKGENKKEGKNVEVKVERNVEVNRKNGLKSACRECEVKDIIIDSKEQIIKANTKTIHSHEAQIQLLQNQLDQMKYDIQERDRNKQPEQKERKTA